MFHCHCKMLHTAEIPENLLQSSWKDQHAAWMLSKRHLEHSIRTAIAWRIDVWINMCSYDNWHPTWVEQTSSACTLIIITFTLSKTAVNLCQVLSLWCVSSHQSEICQDIRFQQCHWFSSRLAQVPNNNLMKKAQLCCTGKVQESWKSIEIIEMKWTHISVIIELHYIAEAVQTHSTANQ